MECSDDGLHHCILSFWGKENLLVENRLLGGRSEAEEFRSGRRRTLLIRSTSTWAASQSAWRLLSSTPCVVAPFRMT